MRRRVDFNWMELLVGIIFILMGIYSFQHPELTLTGFVIVYGLLAVISGIADIAFYVRLERFTGFGPTTSLLLGILNVLMGFFLIINNDFGIMAAAILFPIWFISHCAGKLLNVNFIRFYGGKMQFWITLTINIVGIVLGFMLLFNPFASAASMVYIAGTYLVLVGIGSIISAFGNDME